MRETIQGLVENIRRFKKFEFELCAEEETEVYLNNEQKLMVYRVVQEQLNNIIKYADAQKVSVALYIKGDHVYLTIKDDGNGFNPEDVKTGIGLKNIKSRLDAFYGHLNIHSAPGKGCLLEASFNLI